VVVEAELLADMMMKKRTNRMIKIPGVFMTPYRKTALHITLVSGLLI
jgi:hypothetical protein